jgi:2-polyprenyl-3-methyl-5-hydroxy-6-metoxy-1,4-benzoquinol methylase
MATQSKLEQDDKHLFDRISTQYVKKDLHPASRVARMQRLAQTMAKANVSPTCTLLEVGCGGGFSAEYLRGYYKKYIGVDYSEGLISYAKQQRGGEDVSFFTQNIKEFAPPEPIDVIVMIGVLHHMDDMLAAMRLMYGMLRPGGQLIINEPQPANPLISAARFVRKAIDKNYSSDQRELPVEELQALYANAGFEKIKFFPQGFFSTPFAEVAMRPVFITKRLSHLACRIDRTLEKSSLEGIMRNLSWNVIGVGRKPVP